MAKLTTATKLAAAAEKAKPPVTLSQEFSEYAKVFSKEATNHVPPSHPYDHEINLDESFSSKIGKIYPLSPEKKKVTKDFLKENLASGKIHPSNSPQASPFSSSRKRMESFTPAKTTAI